MRKLTDAQIDEYLDPNFLKDHVPGFEEAMDSGRVMAAATRDMAKSTGKTVDGWRHIANIPWELMSVLYQVYTPEELSADGGKVLLDFIKRNRQYYGVHEQ